MYVAPLPYLGNAVGSVWKAFAKTLDARATILNFVCVVFWQGVVRTPVSANPGLNFNLGFFFFLSKALYRIIFSILFRLSNHQIVGKDN